MELLLDRLIRWYESQCNGDWEHTWGIKIDTLDNPGWKVEINLQGTALASRKFEPVAEGLSVEGWPNSERWIQCSVGDNLFHGAGDSQQLQRILKIFLDWADAQ